MNVETIDPRPEYGSTEFIMWDAIQFTDQANVDDWSYFVALAGCLFCKDYELGMFLYDMVNSITNGRIMCDCLIDHDWDI